MEAFSDPKVNAIFPGTGGYGTTRIVDKLDYNVIRRNGKILVGFSDITGLHIAINQKTGLVTFHSPNPEWGLGVDKNLSPFAAKWFWWVAILAKEYGPNPGYLIRTSASDPPAPGDDKTIRRRPAHPHHPRRQGPLRADRRQPLRDARPHGAPSSKFKQTASCCSSKMSAKHRTESTACCRRCDWPASSTTSPASSSDSSPRESQEAALDARRLPRRRPPRLLRQPESPSGNPLPRRPRSLQRHTARRRNGRTRRRGARTCAFSRTR